ncbi:MAG: dTDP-4-dehydrorhamnose 3,5-epimerase [Acidobacteria bacterium]|nr:dTDP-4-dehydrorhamnose 3,5-epimerase [Acidobacteriota bacterium]NIM62559.1 dTDP-4-dehydrorhamnose 3,5-epimerase [Acidobacteriota bacterium]NIO58292.1 dTDP-4-dehydrorhamnose 3,5-epimerase [Acidobacteriota bacterium]NIQ29348.1 dTDP-4-dehydrorhamnose 3,5-epimerase [Acidobacteriota bacterium]NIQ83948.1 dTDP-4-dehydrorhamnose 3,5-epimerase [Acidobacteriota bacterium]
MKLTADADSVLRVQRYDGSPSIDGVEFTELRRFNDDGGAMTELLRFEEDRPAGLEGFEPRQLNYSILQPGAIKAFHLHRRQTDVWFVPPEDRILMVLVDVRAGSPSAAVRQRFMLGDGTSRFVRVPPGVAHGCRNIGAEEARILYLTDLVFDPDPEQCDEGRLPWDFAGAEIWDVVKE